ncbi:MAG TPA: (2Fe-2S)-binding protein [Desulfobulbus sp.]|nr:(2Fe-2S)-binding protein [Desulfobulbus sp.]
MDEEILARLKPGCICKGVRLFRLMEAIEAGATDFAQVAARTGIGDGSCGGRRCGARVEELLARHGRQTDGEEEP